jgi:hypothetical protein
MVIRSYMTILTAEKGSQSPVVLKTLRKFPSLIHSVYTILPFNCHRNIQRLTTVHNSPMPVIDAAHRSLLTAMAIHSSQVDQGSNNSDILDWSALVAGSRVAAGLPGLDCSRSVSELSLVHFSGHLNNINAADQSCERRLNWIVSILMKCCN